MEIQDLNAKSESSFLNKQEDKISVISKKTRFQVKKIDFNLDGHDQNGTSGHEDDTGDTERLCNDDNVTGSYDTQYLKSLRNYTREPLPHAAHYRNTLTMHTHHDRPTLDELHDPSATVSPDTHKFLPRYGKKEASGVLKLGWIQGVFVRCLLNIWGIILFLRIPWAVGQAGIMSAVLIMLLATTVTFLTTISMSAICTNGEVKGGGAYYMISRSLGPEFGGAIGAIFSLANAVAVAMYVVGFCESVIGLMVDNNLAILDADIQDVRIIGVIVVTILLGIAIIGMEWENKAQLVLLVILLAAMANFIFGAFMKPTSEKLSQGFVGISLDVMVNNFFSDYRGKNFIEVFAIVFPAATGILAGANISGDLANPSKAIPKGTFLAIIITTFSYILFMVLCGITTLRDANGIVGLDMISQIQNCSMTSDSKCRYGLHNSDQVISMIAPYAWIIYAGIFAASLSSALASLVSAPKIFQALCNDKLFPYIHVFGKGYGKANEPRRAYFLTYLIAVGCILIGQLNLIAPIISNFFLAAYCIVNFSCFHVSFTNSPGWRPAFRWYNKWIALLTSILCFVVMVISNWVTAIITIVLAMFLYVYIYYRKPDVNWGSSDHAGAYMRALRAVKKTVDVPDHVKNYRPQVLVFSGLPSHRPALVDFASLLTKKISLMVCGDIHTGHVSVRTRRKLSQRAIRFLEKQKVEAFYELKQDRSFSDAAKSLMELSGLGKLRPNIMLIGYKSNWQQAPDEDILEYFKTIHYAFDLHLSVCVLRVPGGFDFSEYEESVEQFNEHEKKMIELEYKKTELVYNASDRDFEMGITPNVSAIQLSSENSPSITPAISRNNLNESKTKDEGGIVIDFTKTPAETKIDMNESKDHRKISVVSATVDKSSSELLVKKECVGEKIERVLTKEQLWNMNQFQTKERKGTIDVWWLYDDGGLTMLLPYLLSTRSQYEYNILRVFTLANRKDELDREKRNMAALLSKFRIDFQDVTVVPDIIKPPKSETVREFESLISKFREDENSFGGEQDSGDCVIRESELLALKDKNNRHIRLRELLLEHSADASLIVMTLTVPRKGTCSAPLFLAWLEMLTKDMPPVLLVRGNQSTVLTFYS